jgi:hypothetical protein
MTTTNLPKTKTEAADLIKEFAITNKIDIEELAQNVDLFYTQNKALPAEYDVILGPISVYYMCIQFEVEDADLAFSLNINQNVNILVQNLIQDKELTIPEFVELVKKILKDFSFQTDIYQTELEKKESKLSDEKLRMMTGLQITILNGLQKSGGLVIFIMQLELLEYSEDKLAEINNLFELIADSLKV